MKKNTMDNLTKIVENQVVLTSIINLAGEKVIDNVKFIRENFPDDEILNAYANCLWYATSRFTNEVLSASENLQKEISIKFDKDNQKLRDEISDFTAAAAGNLAGRRRK